MSGSYKQINVAFDYGDFGRTIKNNRATYNSNLYREPISLSQLVTTLSETLSSTHLLENTFIKTIENLYIQGLRKKIKNLDKRIKEQDKKFTKKINTLREWTRVQLETQRQEYLNIAQEQQQQLEKLKQEVNNILKIENQRAEFAKSLINDLKLLINDLEKNYPHNKFCPGKLNKIINKTEVAQENIEMNLPQAAVAEIHNVYFEFIDLKNEIIEKMIEFEFNYNITLQAGELLLENIKSLEKIIITEKIKEDTDYWSYNTYSKLKKEVEDLVKKLKNQKENLSLKEVNFIKETIEDLDDKLNNIISITEKRIISSQIRAEISDLVISELKGQGFNIIWRGYEKNDPRNSYIVIAENIANTKLTVIISPFDDTLKNSINFAFSDATYVDEQTKFERVYSFAKLLENAGLKVEAPKKGKDIDILKLYDTEALIQKGIPKKIKEELKLQ